MLNPINSFNGIGLTPSVEAGGKIPVWQNPEDLQKKLGGFIVSNLPTAPALVSGGTPIAVDEDTRQAVICKRFEVYEAASGSPTSYKVIKDSGKYNMLETGMVLMKMPATIAGTGVAYAVATLDTANAAYDTLTVATTLGDVVAGDVLAEATEVGTGKSLLASADGLNYEDILVQVGVPYYSASLVYCGAVYARRIRKVATIEQAEMPQIEFSQSK